jgi:hypothetical protein
VPVHRSKAVVSVNGPVNIERLPFPAGKPVEVAVFPVEEQSLQGVCYSVRGFPWRKEPLTLPSPQTGEGTSDSYFSNDA